MDDLIQPLINFHNKRPLEDIPEKSPDYQESDYDFTAIFEWGEKLDVELIKPPKKMMRSASTESEALSESSSKKKIVLPRVTVSRSKKLPTRDDKGRLHFSDFPEFEPNLTPKEILQLGSFGGTCFAPMISSVTGQSYVDAWKEFPADWFEGLDIENQVAAKKYNPKVNKYKVKCGGDLKEWEEAGWVSEIDPYGYFQWYCRFYLGRRCSDDPRQINRAIKIMGPTGRWKKNLVNKCLQTNQPVDQAVNDFSISPKIRQLLQHWGYQLTLDDLKQDGEQHSVIKNISNK